MIYNIEKKRAFVAGHKGMVGSALLRRLALESCVVLTAERSDVDLRRQEQVEAYFRDTRPDMVFLAAATVGGIVANDTRPAEFLYDNLMIQSNIIEAARQVGVEKLLFLGSSCIYPKFAPQPISELSLLTGALEPTNQWYAIAKITGIKTCQAYRRQYGCDFISLMPSNLYGPNDFFDLNGSHVIPALMSKAHSAKKKQNGALTVWGTGAARREFLHVDDLADACIFLMRNYSGEEFVNIGTGEDLTIHELAILIAETVGFTGKIEFDSRKPDGSPQKLLDTTKAKLIGWESKTPLLNGLKSVYQWFLEHQDNIRGVNSTTVDFAQ